MCAHDSAPGQGTVLAMPLICGMMVKRITEDNMNQRFLDQITDFIFVNDIPGRADMIMVPGNGFPQMAERAAQLYHEGHAPMILPSGKYGRLSGIFEGVQDKRELYDETYDTEWEFLHDVLRKCAVPERAILREDQATFTYENAVFSRRVTDAAGIDVRSAIVCCKSYHARRCLMYYQLMYPETDFQICAVEIQGIRRDNWYLSEAGIELVLGEMERCGSQFHEILREMMPIKT